jgi:tetratricopeptide (TPR) repeat protein
VYFIHNLHFILYARSMQGRTAETNKAATEILNALKPMAASMPEMAELFNAIVTTAQLRNYRWDEILSAAQPASKNPLTLALWRYSRALAYAGKRQLSQAATEQAEFEKLRKTVDANIPWGNNKIHDVMELASHALAARMDRSASSAVQKWEKAVAIQDTLVYDEPPAWYYPIRESLGAALLQAGDAARAETVFREGLRRSPNNGRMLFGLLQALKAQNKNESAAWVQKEFDRAWQKADIQLRITDL